MRHDLARFFVRASFVHGFGRARDTRRSATRVLSDGRYDAFVVWAERRDDGVALECAITAGAHRGDVVPVVSVSLATRDELSLVGLPCTLVVAGDTVRVTIP